MSYSFRIRGVRARGDTLNVDAPALDLPSPGPGIAIQLRGWKDVSLKDADSLVLVGTGFGSEGDAWTAGERYERVLMRTLAHLRIGADLGGRAAKSWITDYGLKWLEARAPGQRLLNDVHGLMVFATDPWPKFASMSPTLVRGMPPDRLSRTFEKAFETDSPMEGREQTALDLFSASFFQPSPEARLILRVMAIESLLEPKERSGPGRQHVERLIQATQDEPSLSRDERESLLGPLRWLRQESIGRSGRTLVESRLAGRRYQEKTPAKFFTEAYTVRSNLVHGVSPFPTRKEADRLAAELEVFVSDLLAGPLIDVA